MAPEGRVPTPRHLFQSFWIGGFEAACHLTAAGTRLDMIAATQHDTQVASDYALMKNMGMSTSSTFPHLLRCWPRPKRTACK
jgi:hypothetical protein